MTRILIAIKLNYIHQVLLFMLTKTKLSRYQTPVDFSFNQLKTSKYEGMEDEKDSRIKFGALQLEQRQLEGSIWLPSYQLSAQ